MRLARVIALLCACVGALTGCLRLVDFDEAPVPCERDECDGKCVDVRSNRQHCGSCWAPCLSNQTCVSGHCECTLGVACATGCSTLQDDSNCGACGSVCPTGCKNGSCDCFGAYCSDVCVDLQSDPQNCGVCGHACAPAYACGDGQCGCPSPDQKPCNGACIPVDDTTTDCDCGPDSDGDGVCDEADPCPADAPDDTDGDGKCNSSDPCPLDKPDDSDGDGKCNSTDPCPKDAADDYDSDGVCDSDDPCPVDKPDDSDNDGVCDTSDQCPGHLDTDDADQDGIPDACDTCPLDPTGDTDGDGICNNLDQCSLGPDANDADGDLIPDACDLCPVSDKTGDGDGSGFPDVCEKVLFTYSDAFGSGPATNPITVQFTTYYSNQGQGGPCDGVTVGDKLDWTTGQTGSHTFIWKEDPEIVPFMACATDGTNEWLGDAIVKPNGSGGGGVSPEATRGMGSPDLKGKVVTYLRLTVNDFSPMTIGTTPAIHVDFTWQILGYKP